MTAPVCEHCCHPPSFKAREAQQAPYRGMWGAICTWEQEQNPSGEMTPLRAALYRIADEQPDARATFAINTTRAGRPLDEAAPAFEEAQA